MNQSERFKRMARIVRAAEGLDGIDLGWVVARLQAVEIPAAMNRRTIAALDAEPADAD